MKRNKLIVLMATAACAGCGAETTFVGSPAPVEAAQVQTSDAGVASDAIEAWVESVEEFSLTPEEVLVRDRIYTLVVADNSASMSEEIAAMVQGLSDLPAGLFRADDRIAVQRMSLFQDDGVTLHPLLSTYVGMPMEPGTASLVTDAQIKAYLAQPDLAQAYKDKYALAGPETPWFHPTARHPAGHSLMRAALQNPYHGIGLEAGMHALQQFLERFAAANPGDSLTEGAHLNVVFISDEVHPGFCRNSASLDNSQRQLCEDLLARCPTPGSMAQAMKAAGVPSFKFHGAIHAAEKGPCSYQELITATGGKAITIGTSPAIYSRFFDAVQSQAIRGTVRSTFRTKTMLSAEVRVEVDGVDTKNFLVVDGQTIEVDVPRSATKVRIVIPTSGST